MKVYAVVDRYWDGDSVQGLFTDAGVADEVASVCDLDVEEMKVDPKIDFDLLRSGLKMWGFFWVAGYGWSKLGADRFERIPIECLLNGVPSLRSYKCDRIHPNEYFCGNILAKTEEEAKRIAKEHLEAKFGKGLS